MSDHLVAALSIAAEGQSVFPCAPGGKTPLTKHGYLDATTDAATIHRWWTRCPSANIALPTGGPTGYDVVDVDVRADGDGWAAFRRAREGGLLDGWTRAVRTPSGGLHLYFAGTDQRNGTIPGAHIDFRGTGGYILVPPSRVVVAGQGRPYQLIAQQDATTAVSWGAIRRLLDPRSIARPPAVTTRRMDGESLVNTLATWLRTQPEGNRNAALYWAACRAADQRAPDPRALITASIANGIPHAEAAATVASAYRRLKVDHASGTSTAARTSARS